MEQWKRAVWKTSVSVSLTLYSPWFSSDGGSQLGSRLVMGRDNMDGLI